MRDLHSIKPQDILLLLKLLTNSEETQVELSLKLDISQTEVSLGLRRLKNAGLLSADAIVNREASLEFITHGLKYVFPPQFGALAVGVPTSFAKPGFKFVRYTKDDIFVWPHPEGSKRGNILRPIHSSFPDACLKDDKLYTLAALVEMIRSGRVREKNIAAKELEKLVLES